MNTSNFCNRLKEERKRLGLNQAVTAELCGVKRETWSRYESGALAPGKEVLTALAEKGADVQYILTGIHSGTLMTSREAMRWATAHSVVGAVLYGKKLDKQEELECVAIVYNILLMHNDQLDMEAVRHELEAALA